MEIQKFKYLDNEKSFLDEIKSSFHSFWRAIIWLKIEIWSKIEDKSFKEMSPPKCKIQGKDLTTKGWAEKKILI